MLKPGWMGKLLWGSGVKCWIARLDPEAALRRMEKGLWGDGRECAKARHSPHPASRAVVASALWIAASMSLTTDALAQQTDTKKSTRLSLPSPACIHHPEKMVCKLDRKTLQRREQDVINHQWNLVRKAIPELQTATLVRPFESDVPAENALYKNYCEALRADLIQGRYKVFRKPDVASSQAGIGKLAEGFSEVERKCNISPGGFTDSSDTLQGDWDFEGGRWLYKLTDGFAILSFDLPTQTHHFFYNFNACNSGHGLPTWKRKGESQEYSRTDVVGMTVLERGERTLIGLEYLEVHGNADGYNRNEYNGALQPSEYQAEPGPVPRGMITIDGKQVIPWRGGAPIEWDPPPPPEPPVRFIGAFMAPPPWDSIYPELQQEAPGQPMHNEPCLWKLSH